jgi:glyoxylase-like metal-dependent hydrolase (beta-lactamase superfamily II)
MERLTLQIGNISLNLVSDGVFWEDGAGLFGLVPRVLWRRIVEPDTRNRIPLQNNCLVIETPDRKRILVDTGCGDKLSEAKRSQMSLTGTRRLLGSLKAIGLSPSDIDLVINTHLHFDHSGANTYYDERGHLQSTFPNATYCVQRLELADAQYPNERTSFAYDARDIEPIQREGQLRVLWGDTWLAEGVRVEVTPGHTRSHQSVVIESGDEVAVYLGDLAPWPIQLQRLAWVPAYDVEPLVSIETKRRLARWAIERQALLIFDHHPEVIAGYLHPTERPDHFRLEPVEMSA